MGQSVLIFSGFASLLLRRLASLMLLIANLGGFGAWLT
jgi:hypothetical protein